MSKTDLLWVITTKKKCSFQKDLFAIFVIKKIIYIIFIDILLLDFMILMLYYYIFEKTFCYGVQGGDYCIEVLKYPSAGASPAVLPHYARAKGPSITY